MVRISIPTIPPRAAAPLSALSRLPVREAAAHLGTFLDKGGGNTLILTGAGVSVDSGIRAYRGEGGHYANPNYKPILYHELIEKSPRGQLFRQRYWARSFLGYPPVREAKPNPTHIYVAALQALGLAPNLITQNVDNLHPKALALLASHLPPDHPFRQAPATVPLLSRLDGSAPTSPATSAGASSSHSSRSPTISPPSSSPSTSSSPASSSSSSFAPSSPSLTASPPRSARSLSSSSSTSIHASTPPPRILELHGTLARVHCLDHTHEQARDEYQEELAGMNPVWDEEAKEAERTGRRPRTNPDGDVELEGVDFTSFRVPPCRVCEAAGEEASVVKPNVVFFGETLRPTVRDSSLSLVSSCTNLLVLGTSLATYSAFRLVKQAREMGKDVLMISLGPSRADDLDGVVKMERRAGEVLRGFLEGVLRDSSGLEVDAIKKVMDQGVVVQPPDVEGPRAEG